MLTAQKKAPSLRLRMESHRIRGGEAMPARFEKDLALSILRCLRHSPQTPACPMPLAMPAALPTLRAPRGGLLCLGTFPSFVELWRKAAAQAAAQKNQDKVTHL